VRRAQAAEAARRAEEQRRREAELEQQRIDAENKRHQEEIEKQAEFIRDRDKAAGALRGSTGIRATSNESGGAVLRGSSADTGLRGVKPATDAYGLRGSGVRAGNQLKSAEMHSRVGGVLRDELSSDQAQKGFDTAGTNHGTLVYPDKKGAGMPAFASKIPKDLLVNNANNTRIIQSLAWYQHLERTKVDTAKKITAVKEQQKKGGDATILSAQLATLQNEMKRLAGDQAKTEKSIKTEVVNRGYKWDEGTLPTTPKAGEEKK